MAKHRRHRLDANISPEQLGVVVIAIIIALLLMTGSPQRWE